MWADFWCLTLGLMHSVYYCTVPWLACPQKCYSAATRTITILLLLCSSYTPYTQTSCSTLEVCQTKNFAVYKKNFKAKQESIKMLTKTKPLRYALDGKIKEDYTISLVHEQLGPISGMYLLSLANGFREQNSNSFVQELPRMPITGLQLQNMLLNCAGSTLLSP